MRGSDALVSSSGKICRKVVCGSRHCYVVSERGEAWGWGWSLHGQCASAAPAVESPTLATGLRGLRVVSLAAGLAHTLAVSDTGDVYRSAKFQTLACCSPHHEKHVIKRNF